MVATCPFCLITLAEHKATKCLDAWAAQEVHGWKEVKLENGDYHGEGKNNKKEKIPDYKSLGELRSAKQVVRGNRKINLVIKTPGMDRDVEIDEADMPQSEEVRALALKAIILAAMHEKGKI